MNTTQFKSFIKEQLQKIIKEDYQDKYKMEGILITNLDERPQKEIYSDIRALPGVTIVSSTEPIEYSEQDTSKFRTVLTVKIDGYPWIKKGGFGRDKLPEIISMVRKVPAVKSFIVDKDKVVGI